MNNKLLSKEKVIYSMKEYYESYFPKKSKFKSISNKTDELALHSVDSFFIKYKEVLHKKA